MIIVLWISHKCTTNVQQIYSDCIVDVLKIFLGCPIAFLECPIRVSHSLLGMSHKDVPSTGHPYGTKDIGFLFLQPPVITVFFMSSIPSNFLSKQQRFERSLVYFSDFFSYYFFIISAMIFSVFFQHHFFNTSPTVINLLYIKK